MTRDAAQIIARAICAEHCAFMGEPPCWQIVPDEWPNPNCDEPGCTALGERAAEELARFALPTPPAGGAHG